VKPNELYDSQKSGMLVNAREYSKMAPQLCNEMLGEYGIMEGFIFSKISVRDLNATHICVTLRTMLSVKNFLHNMAILKLVCFLCAGPFWVPV
jgi:hypothetical protein